jgi:hypothetical protein
MIGSVIGVSYIAKIIGGSREAQAVAALIAVTIPMGILESTSTQNDYVVALWVISFTAFSLTIAAEGPSFGLVLLTGASLGLASLTKSTGLVFTAPIAVWVGFNLLRRRRAAAWKLAFVILVVALVINAGHFARNSLLYGSPLGPRSESPDGISFKYTNDTYTVATLTSNLLRNSALHFGTPFRSLNAAVYEAISGIHCRLGLDINDPRTTWTGTNFKIEFSQHEERAGNPLHFALLGLSLLLVLRYRGHKTVAFGICVAAGFVLFSVLLKWQPWHSRLQLPFFVLSSAFAAVVLDTAFHHRLVSLLLVALTVSSFPYLLGNASRPVIGANSVLCSDRMSQYFKNRPDLAIPYERAAALVRGTQCTEMGLITGGDDWEYPLWVLTGAARGRRRLEHIAVDNVSGRIPVDFTPCAVIATRPQLDEEIAYRGTTYKKVPEAGSVAVFLPQGFLPPDVPSLVAPRRVQESVYVGNQRHGQYRPMTYAYCAAKKNPRGQYCGTNRERFPDRTLWRPNTPLHPTALDLYT